MRRSVCPLLVAVAAVTGSSGLAEERPIEDNSFLVEEAYNQEAGVVQHITTYLRSRNGGGWTASFTQEWPVAGQKHQLSYGLVYVHPDDAGSGDGLGDLSLNYRFQGLGAGGETNVALAPRLSIVVPAGQWRGVEETGAVGVQVNVPFSIALGRFFVTHANLGATHLWNARSSTGEKTDLALWNAGASLVWLARPRFNALVEMVWYGGETALAAGDTEPFDSFFVSPGFRWAHDLPGGLQIVPGVAAPIGVGESSGERAVFLYLSFEHPFGKARTAP